MPGPKNTGGASPNPSTLAANNENSAGYKIPHMTDEERWQRDRQHPGHNPYVDPSGKPHNAGPQNANPGQAPGPAEYKYAGVPVPPQFKITKFTFHDPKIQKGLDAADALASSKGFLTDSQLHTYNTKLAPARNKALQHQQETNDKLQKFQDLAKLGEKGIKVQQWVLNQHGYNLAVDGVMGNDTADALANYVTTTSQAAQAGAKTAIDAANVLTLHGQRNKELSDSGQGARERDYTVKQFEKMAGQASMDMSDAKNAGDQAKLRAATQSYRTLLTQIKQLKDPLATDNVAIDYTFNQLLDKQFRDPGVDPIKAAEKAMKDATPAFWSVDHAKQVLGEEFSSIHDNLLLGPLVGVLDKFGSEFDAMQMAWQDSATAGHSFPYAIAEGFAAFTGSLADSLHLGHITGFDRLLKDTPAGLAVEQAKSREYRAAEVKAGDIESLGQLLTGNHSAAYLKANPQAGGLLGLQINGPGGKLRLADPSIKGIHLTSGLVDLVTLPFKDPTYLVTAGAAEEFATAERMADEAVAKAAKTTLSTGESALDRMGAPAVRAFARRSYLDTTQEGRNLTNWIGNAFKDAGDEVRTVSGVRAMFKGIDPEVAAQIVDIFKYGANDEEMYRAAKKLVLDEFVNGKLKLDQGWIRKGLDIVGGKVGILTEDGTPGFLGLTPSGTGHGLTFVTDRLSSLGQHLRDLASTQGTTASVFEKDTVEFVNKSVETATAAEGHTPVSAWDVVAKDTVEAIDLPSRMTRIADAVIELDNPSLTFLYRNYMRPLVANLDWFGDMPLTTMLRSMAQIPSAEESIKAMETVLGILEGKLGTKAKDQLVADLERGLRPDPNYLKKVVGLAVQNVGKELPKPSGGTPKLKLVVSELDALPENLQGPLRDRLETIAAGKSKAGLKVLLRDIRVIAEDENVQEELGNLIESYTRASEEYANRVPQKMGLGQRILRAPLRLASDFTQIAPPAEMRFEYQTRNELQNAIKRESEGLRYMGAFHIPQHVQNEIAYALRTAQTEDEFFKAVHRMVNAALDSAGVDDRANILSLMRERGDFRAKTKQVLIRSLDEEGNPVENLQTLAQRMESIQVPSPQKVADALRKAILDGTQESNVAQRLSARLHVDVIDKLGNISLHWEQPDGQIKNVKMALSQAHRLWKFLVVSNAGMPLIGMAGGFIGTKGSILNRLQGAGLGFAIGSLGMSRFVFRIAGVEDRIRMWMDSGFTAENVIPGYARMVSRGSENDLLRTPMSQDLVRVGNAGQHFENDWLVHVDKDWEAIPTTDKNAEGAYYRIVNHQVRPEDDPVMAILLREKAGHLGGDIIPVPKVDTEALNTKLADLQAQRAAEVQRLKDNGLTEGDKLNELDSQIEDVQKQLAPKEDVKLVKTKPVKEKGGKRPDRNRAGEIPPKPSPRQEVRGVHQAEDGTWLGATGMPIGEGPDGVWRNPRGEVYSAPKDWPGLARALEIDDAAFDHASHQQRIDRMAASMKSHLDSVMNDPEMRSDFLLARIANGGQDRELLARGFTQDEIDYERARLTASRAEGVINEADTRSPLQRASDELAASLESGSSPAPVVDNKTLLEGHPDSFATHTYYRGEPTEVEGSARGAYWTASEEEASQVAGDHGTVWAVDLPIGRDTLPLVGEDAAVNGVEHHGWLLEGENAQWADAARVHYRQEWVQSSVIDTVGLKSGRQAADEAIAEFLDTEEGKIWAQRWRGARLGAKKPEQAVATMRKFIDRYFDEELAALRVSGGPDGVAAAVDRQTLQSKLKLGVAGHEVHGQKVTRIPRNFRELFRTGEDVVGKLFLSGPTNMNRIGWENRIFNSEFDRLVQEGVNPVEAQKLADLKATEQVNGIMHRFAEQTRIAHKVDAWAPFTHARLDMIRAYTKLALENPMRTIRVEQSVARAFNYGKDKGIFVKDNYGNWTMVIPGSARLARSLFGMPIQLDFTVNIKDLLFMPQGAYGGLMIEPGGLFWSGISAAAAHIDPSLFEGNDPIHKWLWPYGPEGQLLSSNTSRLWMAMTGQTPPWEVENTDHWKNELNHWREEVALELMYQDRLKGKDGHGHGYIPTDAEIDSATKKFFKTWAITASLMPGRTYPVLANHQSYYDALNAFTAGGLLPRYHTYVDTEGQQHTEDNFLKQHPEYEPYIVAGSETEYTGPDDLASLKKFGVNTPFGLGNYDPETGEWVQGSGDGNDSYTKQRAAGVRNYKDWATWRDEFKQHARTAAYYREHDNASRYQGNPAERDRRIAAVNIKYSDVVRTEGQHYAIKKELWTIANQYPRQLQDSAYKRVQATYHLSNAELGKLKIAAAANPTWEPNVWVGTRSGTEIYTEVSQKFGPDMASPQAMQYIATLKPTEQARLWHYMSDSIGYEDSFDATTQAGESYSHGLDSPQGIINRFDFYQKNMYAVKDAYPQLEYKKADAWVNPFEKQTKKWDKQTADAVAVAHLAIDTLNSEKEEAWKSKNYKAYDALTFKINDYKDFIRSYTDRQLAKVPDLTKYYQDLHAATMYEAVGNDAEARTYRRMAQHDKLNAPYWMPHDEFSFLHKPPAVQQAYIAQMADGLDMPPVKGGYDLTQYIYNHDHTYQLYWDHLTPFQQAQMTALYPNRVEGWKYKSEFYLRGPGLNKYGTGLSGAKLGEIPVDLQYANDMLTKHDKRGGKPAPKSLDKYLSLPRNAGAKAAYLAEHPDLLEWLQLGPLGQMTGPQRDVVINTMIKYSSTDGGNGKSRSWYGPHAKGASKGYNGEVGPRGSGYADYKWAKYQLYAWSHRPQGAKAPATYDLWLNMPSGPEKAQYIKDHPEIGEWIRLGAMANMPEPYKVLVQSIMQQYGDWTAQQNPLGDTISQFYATPGYAKQNFLEQHPELQVYWSYTRTPEEQAMFDLENSYFQIQDVGAKQLFLLEHPDLQKHFMDARTQRYQIFMNQVASYMGANPEMFKEYLAEQNHILAELLRRFALPNLIREVSPRQVGDEAHTAEGGRGRAPQPNRPARQGV